MSDHIHRSPTLLKNDITKQKLIFATVRFHIHKTILPILSFLKTALISGRSPFPPSTTHWPRYSCTDADDTVREPQRLRPR